MENTILLAWPWPTNLNYQAEYGLSIWVANAILLVLVGSNYHIYPYREFDAKESRLLYTVFISFTFLH